MSKANTQKLIRDTFLDLARALETGRLEDAPGIALSAPGSEHGEDNALQAALQASRNGVHVHYIGSLSHPDLTCHEAQNEAQAHQVMERLLADGTCKGAVAMHYPFPIGVATVGRVPAPATGKPIYLATTTGTAATDRVEAMVRGAIAGIITAKACGVEQPAVGLLNIDGARQAEGILKKLNEQGYPITFAESARSGGGCVLRGNDVLAGSSDVVVMDSLTGNVIIKMLSAFTSGGIYETTGDGYGPGIGEGYDRLVAIVSRASGAAVVANALSYTAQVAGSPWQDIASAEYRLAYRAGLKALLDELSARRNAPVREEIQPPPQEAVTQDIAGVEVMELEEAVRSLWKKGIYAQSGMGCTGPVVMVSEQNLSRALAALKEGGFVSG